MITAQEAKNLAETVNSNQVDAFVEDFKKQVNDAIVDSAKQGKFCTSVAFPAHFKGRFSLQGEMMRQVGSQLVDFHCKIDSIYNWLNISWSEGE